MTISSSSNYTAQSHSGTPGLGWLVSRHLLSATVHFHRDTFLAEYHNVTEKHVLYSSHRTDAGRSENLVAFDENLEVAVIKIRKALGLSHQGGNQWGALTR